MQNMGRSSRSKIERVAGSRMQSTAGSGRGSDAEQVKSTQQNGKPSEEGGNTRIQQVEANLQRVIALLSTHFEEKEESTSLRDGRDIEKVLDRVAKVIRNAKEGNKPSPKQNFSVAKRKTQFYPLELERVRDAVPFTKYFTMRFDINSKRAVNPYDVQDKVKQTTGNKAKITTLNRTSFLIEASNQEQSEKLENIESIKDLKCEVIPYDRFNYSKGLIFVSEFEISDLEEFKRGLQERYAVVRVERATFIKTKGTTSAYIITFSQEYVPYSIYIPGERFDTRVKPFMDRPMICNNCQMYGHTAKKCSRAKVCRQCSEEGHGKEECRKGEKEFKCCHCSESHAAGSQECSKHQRESDLLDIQRKQKVTFKRARQIQIGESETTSTWSEDFEKRFECLFSEADRKKFTPWSLEKGVESYLKRKPKSIRAKGKEGFIVEIETKTESELMKNMKEIYGYEVKTTVSKDRLRRVLLYVKEYNMMDFETYKKGLMEQFGFQDVVEATWIKTKNDSSKPLLVSVSGNDLPSYIELPGEQDKTKVYEYKERPQLCQRCLEYGHRTKFCTRDVRCKKCYEISHMAETCQATQKNVITVKGITI